jgi:quinoprotein glucose dehydrogenase
MTEEELQQLLKKGRGMMPAFSHVSEEERNGIISFLWGKEDAIIKVSDSAASKVTSPYIHSGYDRWYDSKGYPVNAPPWGTLTAINLQSGEHLWQVPLGEFPSLKEKGVAPTGTDNHGGPLVTASGLIFIAATPDKKFRAYDKQNGNILWEMDLPAAGYASPSTYAVNNRQYVVIACGGGKLLSTSGDKYVGFAIKE